MKRIELISPYYPTADKKEVLHIYWE